MPRPLRPKGSGVPPLRSEKNRSVSTAGKAQTYETNDQRPLSRTALRSSPVPQPTTDMLPSLPQAYYSSLFPSTWGSGAPWDPSCPPTVTFSLKGLHFSYDHTSSFSASTREYKGLLLGNGFHRNPDLYRKIRYTRPLLGPSKEEDVRRHFVLSLDTLVVLELDFTPGPSHSLIFDALEVPLTCSVKCSVDSRGRRLLSLQIILVDAVTEAFVRVGKQDRDEEGDQKVVLPLVDFQAEHNITDLRDGRVTVRFKLPCCLLDSRHRTGCYRICIAWRLDDQQFGYHTLPGIFEVAHMKNKIPKSSLHYPRGAISVDYLSQPPHNYCCSARNNGRDLHSDLHNITGGCFEWLFSLALGLDCIPIRNILNSANHQRVLSSLLPAERRQLRQMIQLEYYYIERTLTQAGYDVTLLRGEHDYVSQLTELVAPIHWLPVELLESVFSFVPDEQFENLMRTCHKWREVALSMLAPLKLTSWTSFDEVKAILDRGNGSLSVTIDPFSDVKDLPMGSLETERYAALVLVLSTSVSRWRTLKILSLPDPKQTNALFGEQGHTIDTVPMNRLKSLSIPTHRDTSLFLGRLLQSIGATISDQLTNMDIRSAQAMSYLAQLHCAKVFTYLTSFKCFLPRTNEVFDILPHFRQLESLDVSGFRFPSYAADVELPIAKTLRQISLRGVPVGWMSHREFPQLESCTIVSPPVSDAIPITSIPGCKELVFEGPRFDPIRKFRISIACKLTLHSTQWKKSGGNEQLSQLWGAVPNEGILNPSFLHLHLNCGNDQLLQALCFMPELKELVLELDRPTALGRRFFMGFLTPSSQITCSRTRAGRSRAKLQVCPLLEVLGLKYRRWFRPGEVNEMPALVAMAHSDARDRKFRIWVEKSISDQERVEIDRAQISASNLYSLGLLQFINGEQPPSRVVKEMIDTSLSPMSIKFDDGETMIHFSPSIYACIFQHLRAFFLCSDIDQRVLLGAIVHFEHLEEIRLYRFSPSSPNHRLPLLRTLKTMWLDVTSLSWMEGCTFVKLEDVAIGHIEKDDSDQFQCVRMPMCKSASFPQSISLELRRGFEMPRLLNLHLHHQGSDQTGELHCPTTQQFKLHTASFHCVRSGELQDFLATQPNLEVLEIKGLVYPCQSARGLTIVLDSLVSCQNAGSLGNLDQSKQGTLRQELHSCPKLKELKLELADEWAQEWEQEWEQEEEQEEDANWQRQHKARVSLMWQRAVEELEWVCQEQDVWKEQGGQYVWDEQGEQYVWEVQGEQYVWEEQSEQDVWEEQSEQDVWEEQSEQDVWEEQGEQDVQREQKVQVVQVLLEHCYELPQEWREILQDVLEQWKGTSVAVWAQGLMASLRFEGTNWETSGTILCQKFMWSRRAKGCPLQRCQVTVGSWVVEVTESAVIPGPEFLDFGDIGEPCNT